MKKNPERTQMACGMRIGRMEEADLSPVLSIEASSHQGCWSRQSFVEELMNPLSFCFVARGEMGAADEVFGFICFRVIGEESELFNLGVHPRYRQRGFAKQLMKFYLDFCEKQKTKVFYLETRVSNKPAIRLYQCFCYRPAGIRPKYFQGKEDALLMVRRAPVAEISPCCLDGIIDDLG